MYAKFHHTTPLSSRDRAIFTFFRIWRSAKPRPMKNVISQYPGLDLANVNVYAKVYQNIPLNSRDRAISLFQNSNLGNASANPKWHLTISWATSFQYKCVCKILSKYSKRFKSYRHFSKSLRTGRGQNLQKLSCNKIKYLIIGHSMKFNFKFQLTFLGSCNQLTLKCTARSVHSRIYKLQ